MFYDNLATICEQNNTTVSNLAKTLEIPRPTVYSWKNNGATPRPAVVGKITDYLKVEPAKLVDGKKDGTKPANDVRKQMLDSFKVLNPRGQKIAASRIKELTEIARYAN